MIDFNSPHQSRIAFGAEDHYLCMTKDKRYDLFVGELRMVETEIAQREVDFAASIQHKFRGRRATVSPHTIPPNACTISTLAGGVALICVLIAEKSRQDQLSN